MTDKQWSVYRRVYAVVIAFIVIIIADLPQGFGYYMLLITTYITANLFFKNLKDGKRWL